MPVLYYKEDYATLEISLDGDYLLRVVGVGPNGSDYLVALNDDDLERYRELGDHFVVTLAHRIHLYPDRYASRNLLAPSAAPTPEADSGANAARPSAAWRPSARAAAAVAAIVVAYLLFVALAVRPSGSAVEVVDGRALSLHSVPDESGDRHDLTVRLSDGSEVRVPVFGAADFRENAAVRIRVVRSPILGRKSYRLER